MGKRGKGENEVRGEKGRERVGEGEKGREGWGERKKGECRGEGEEGV